MEINLTFVELMLNYKFHYAGQNVDISHYFASKICGGESVICPVENRVRDKGAAVTMESHLHLLGENNGAYFVS